MQVVTERLASWRVTLALRFASGADRALDQPRRACSARGDRRAIVAGEAEKRCRCCR